MKPTDKKQFVLAQPYSMSASEVVRRAAAAGMSLSVATVYHARTRARRGRGTAEPVAVVRETVDTELRDRLLRMGHRRAMALIDDVFAPWLGRGAGGDA